MNNKRNPGGGAGGGRGQGRGGGRGGGAGGGGLGFGPRGECICPTCGTVAPHQPALPCREMKCPKCGNQMTRK